MANKDHTLKPSSETPNFKWFRIFHGGQDVCKKLQAVRNEYRVVRWQLIPQGSQLLLVVQVIEKDEDFD